MAEKGTAKKVSFIKKKKKTEQNKTKGLANTITVKFSEPKI